MLVNNKYEAILEIRTGSHLYGTNTESSDEDFCGIVLPDVSEVFGFEHMEEQDVSTVSKNAAGKNNSDAVDRKFYEFRKFIKLALDNNPNILEMLFVNDENIIFNSEIGKKLLAMRELFPHQGLSQKFGGYAKSQLHKMQLKPDHYAALQNALEYLLVYIGNDSIQDLYDEEELKRSRKLIVELQPVIEASQPIVPIKFNDSFIQVGDIHLGKNLTVGNVVKYIQTRIANASYRKESYEAFGFDAKFGMHAVRLGIEGLDLLKTGRLEFPLKESKFLLDIRKGLYSRDQVIKMVYDLDMEAKSLMPSTELRKHRLHKEIQDFTIEVLKDYFYKD